MTHLLSTAALISLILTAPIVAAQPSVEPNNAAPAPVPHVRAADDLAREVLEDAARMSPTVAGLIAQLQQSDVITIVGTGCLRGNRNGLAQIAAATSGVRYVRVVLRIPSSKPELMEVLGHELRHAVEIAGMPEVRNPESLGAAYRRIGVAMARDGFFETDAAVETGRMVARELARAK